MSMVETVARALCRSKRNGSGYPEGWVDRHVDENWPLFISDARCAIEAMRVPTDEMLTVRTVAFGDFLDRKDKQMVWAAMIDAALK